MTMKVWVVEDLDHGEVSIWSDDTDPTDIPLVKTELGYVDNDSYRELYEEFLDDLDAIIGRDSGSAEIEERVRVTLETVREG
jgi:hypothetical protein